MRQYPWPVVKDVVRRLKSRTRRWARAEGHTGTADWLGRGQAET